MRQDVFTRLSLLVGTECFVKTLAQLYMLLHLCSADREDNAAGYLQRWWFDDELFRFHTGLNNQTWWTSGVSLHDDELLSVNMLLADKVSFASSSSSKHISESCSPFVCPAVVSPSSSAVLQHTITSSALPLAGQIEMNSEHRILIMYIRSNPGRRTSC